MDLVDFGRPSTWPRFRPSLCDGCRADCCRLPVEATAQDLVRLGLARVDEIAGSLKKLARRLEADGYVQVFRARTGLFMLAQTNEGDCIFLGKDRRCTVYEKRPDVCRQFPTIGPRPGHCPERRQR